jgi:hypothetical protein
MSGNGSGVNNFTKGGVLPSPVVTSTGGETNNFESKTVGGKKPKTKKVRKGGSTAPIVPSTVPAKVPNVTGGKRKTKRRHHKSKRSWFFW